ncbi:MAG: glycosyltransferase family 4 protein [bacterium]
MDILYISQYYPPEMGAPAARVSELSKYWVKFGNNVTVITGMPNHPDGIVHPTYKWEYFKEERKFGVRVLRVLLYVTPNKGVIKRVISFLSFMITSFIVGILKSGTDVVIATSPQLFVGLSGLIIAKLKGKPFIFEVRDIWPHSAVELGVLKNKFIIKMMEKLEMFLYSKAKKIVIVIDSMKEYLVKRGIKTDKIIFIPNGIDSERFNDFQEKTIIRKYPLTEGKFIIAYIGTIGMAHGLDIMIRAAEKTEDRDICYVIIGDGAEKDRVTSIARKKNLDNLLIIDKIPPQDVPAALQEIDMGLVHLRNIPMIALPSKIFEIMASQKPVLAGIKGKLADFIRQNNVGLIFEPENEDDMIKKILSVKNNPNRLRQMSVNGAAIVKEQFSREELAYKYLNYLEEGGCD